MRNKKFCLKFHQSKFILNNIFYNREIIRLSIVVGLCWGCDLPEMFDFGPMRVGRRWMRGFEASLADAERIRKSPGKSSLLPRFVPAVL